MAKREDDAAPLPSPDDLLKEADLALYEAKQAGRNRFSARPVNFDRAAVVPLLTRSAKRS